MMKATPRISTPIVFMYYPPALNLGRERAPPIAERSLPRHRQVQPFLWTNEVIVSVLAQIDLHPVDLS